jgi:hypothetical protein
MAGYIGIPFETDPDVLVDEALESLVANVTGFEPKEAHLEVVLLEVASRINAETRNVGNIVPDTIFRYFGESLVSVVFVEAVGASTATTWTMQDNSGYTVEAGTVVAYRISGDQLVPFSTLNSFTVAPGDTQAIDVVIQSLVAGDDSNGLGPGAWELVDSLSFVSSITASGATSGGLDAETDAAYLSRLRAEMQLLTPRFVLASDAAVLSRRIAGVYRAIGTDNYNPSDDTSDNEKMITVSVVDVDGVALSTTIKDELEAYLATLREINFIIHVEDPTYTDIAVDFTVVASSGYDTTALGAASILAVQTYLSPSVWAGGDEATPTWRSSENVVRYLEVAEVLNRVEGVRYVSALTLDAGTADVALAGVAPLPNATSVTGTAT